MIKMCSFYKSSRKCINKDYCVEQLPSDENCCTSNLYYCMDLEQQNKQMRVAINNIKNLCNEDWEDMTVDKFQNQLLQALKGVE